MIEKYKEGEIVIRIEIDADASSPDENDCEPEFFRAERGSDLQRGLENEFRCPSTAYRTMASGEIYKATDGSWFLGVSEYRHSGSAFALCNSLRDRSFPDRGFDVISLVGWIKVTKQNRIDWGIHGKKGVEEKARSNALTHLAVWEAYINGDVYGYVVEAFPYMEDGETEYAPANVDSCWGYYGSEDAEEAAKEAASWMAETLNWSKA